MKKIRYVFRLIHIDNIPHILRFGIVKGTSINRDPNYVPIGDKTLIESRQEQKIPNTNKQIGDFIPFYFGPRSPMLYTIQHGYNGVTRREPQDLIYCVILIEDIIQSGLSGYFTDGHARNVRTKFYPIERLQELDQLINFEDIFRNSWSISDDNSGEWKRRKSAELLLEKDLPPAYIRGFVVYNEQAKQKLLTYNIKPEKIEIRPNYYF